MRKKGIDFLDDFIARRTAKNPNFPELLKAAMEKRAAARARKGVRR